MHLPGITLNNSSENYEAYSVARFEGASWKLLDEGHWATVHQPKHLGAATMRFRAAAPRLHGQELRMM
jgi:hypothetical protein